MFAVVNFTYILYSGGSRPSDKGGGGREGSSRSPGAQSQKKFFSALRASLLSKNKGAPGAPGLSAGSATVITQCRRTKPKLWHTSYVYTGVGGQFMYDKGTSIHGHKLPLSRSVSDEKRGKG